MNPELFKIPWINYGIKSYGFMMMIGFLTGIYWAARRASKTRSNPDLVLNLGFIALVFGVVGARLFYVAHYWERTFAGKPWTAAIDVTAGGLEFYGGFIGAMVFIIWYLCCHGRPALANALALVWGLLAVFVIIALNKIMSPAAPMSYVLAAISLVAALYLFKTFWQWAKTAGSQAPVSLRLYLDIISPSLMWGLAFGRMGCFLNGCCWGAACTQPQFAWSIQFPCGSPAQNEQWENRQMTLPAPLIMFSSESGDPAPMYRDFLAMSDKQVGSMRERYQRQNKQLADLVAMGGGGCYANRLASSVRSQRQLLDVVGKLTSHAALFGMSIEQIKDLAARQENKSVHVHPSQIYDVINVMLLSFMLNAVFYRRKRHGIVFGLMWLLYPITRIVLETIRADNPLDTAGLTISQGVSVLGLVFAVVWLYGIYRAPQRSPHATPWVPPAN